MAQLFDCLFHLGKKLFVIGADRLQEQFTYEMEGAIYIHGLEKPFHLKVICAREGNLLVRSDIVLRMMTMMRTMTQSSLQLDC